MNSFVVVRARVRSDIYDVAAWVIILYYFTMPDKKRTVDLDWQDVRYFVALTRYGTLSATARALRVNHATVARRVTSLETVC